LHLRSSTRLPQSPRWGKHSSDMSDALLRQSALSLHDTISEVWSWYTARSVSTLMWTQRCPRINQLCNTAQALPDASSFCHVGSHIFMPASSCLLTRRSIQNQATPVMTTHVHCFTLRMLSRLSMWSM
jgi:hypothetical protein